MNSGEFCRQLGIDETALQGLLDSGLPWHGDADDPDFDDSEVATWLVMNGKVEIDTNKVSRNLVDAAAKLGMGKSTLHRWSRLEGFPGRMGYFPIQEIREWDESREKGGNQYGPLEPKDKAELSIKEQRDLLKLNEEKGLLVEVVEVKRILKLSTAYAVAELNLIAGKFESRIPASTDSDLVVIMREVIDQTVRECCTILSEMEMDYIEDEDSDS